MPEVVRLASGDGPDDGVSGRGRAWAPILSQHPAHRRRREVKTRTRQYLGDLHSPHSGTEELQPPHDVANEFGEPVHRLGETDESIGSLLVEARRPGGDGELHAGVLDANLLAEQLNLLLKAVDFGPSAQRRVQAVGGPPPGGGHGGPGKGDGLNDRRSDAARPAARQREGIVQYEIAHGCSPIEA